MGAIHVFQNVMDGHHVADKVNCAACQNRYGMCTRSQLKTFENGATVEVALQRGVVAIVEQRDSSESCHGSGPISATFCGEPIRKYSFARSSRPRARTIFRV